MDEPRLKGAGEGERSATDEGVETFRNKGGEMCAITAVWNAPKAAELAYYGLHKQQHRAVEYAGIVSSDGINPYRYAKAGIVQDVFDQDILDQLHGPYAIGHLRYKTVKDEPSRDNTQPLLGYRDNRFVAMAHNGNITNVAQLESQLDGQTILATSIDTELILRRFCGLTMISPIEALTRALEGVRGSYSLAVLLPDALIAVRDPSGNRPLSLGHRPDGSIFVASETCAYEGVEATYLRDVRPGEMVIINNRGIESRQLPEWSKGRRALCYFEKIYYAFPGSMIFDEYVSVFRYRLGQKLQECCPVPGAHVVIPVPDSAKFIAQGYAASGRSGRFAEGLLRHHYIGRSFIEGDQYLRSWRATRKFSTVPSEVDGNIVVVVDDSIVRLTTMPLIVRLLRQAGAREVHARIACPPITHSCHYGIDTPTREELAAAMMTISEMRDRTEADSLEFLPMEALRELSDRPNDFCYACMDGNYPVFLEPESNVLWVA